MRALIFLALIAAASCYKVTSWDYYDDCEDFDNKAEWQIIVDSADWPDDWYSCDDTATDCYYDYYTYDCSDENEFDFTDYIELDIYEGSYAEGDVIGTVAFYATSGDDCDFASECCYYDGYYISDVTCEDCVASFTSCTDDECSESCSDDWEYAYYLYDYDYFDGNYFSWYQDICAGQTVAAYDVIVTYGDVDCGEMYGWVATPSSCTPGNLVECTTAYSEECVDALDLEEWQSGGYSFTTYCDTDCHGTPYLISWVAGGCWAGAGVSTYVNCDETEISYGTCLDESCGTGDCYEYTLPIGECYLGFEYTCGASSIVLSVAVAVLSLFALLA